MPDDIVTRVEALALQLAAGDEPARLWAAEDLGYLNTAAAVPVLVGRLGDEPAAAVRQAIFRALIRIDAPESMEAAAGLFQSHDPEIRNGAVDVLRRKGGRAVPILLAASRSGDRHVRKLVLDALDGVDTPAARGLCAAALADADPNVVITAVESLGRRRAREYAGRIEELVRPDAHPMLLAVSLEALAAIGGASSLEAVRRAFPRLADVPDVLVSPCLKVFAELGADAEFREIAALLPGCASRRRDGMVAALLALYARCRPQSADGPLPGILEDIAAAGESAIARGEAVRLFGRIAAGGPARLARWLADPERLVRLAAAEALGAIGDATVRAALAGREADAGDEEIRELLLGTRAGS